MKKIKHRHKRRLHQLHCQSNIEWIDPFKTDSSFWWIDDLEADSIDIDDISKFWNTQI